MSKHAPWGNTFIPFSTNVYLCFLAEIVIWAGRGIFQSQTLPVLLLCQLPEGTRRGNSNSGKAATLYMFLYFFDSTFGTMNVEQLDIWKTQFISFTPLTKC